MARAEFVKMLSLTVQVLLYILSRKTMKIDRAASIKPVRAREKNLFGGLLGLVLIGLWCLWFLFRWLYLGAWFAAFLLLISLGELLALLAHFALDVYSHPGVQLLWQSTLIHSALFGVSTVAALIIFLDHRRLESTDKRHRQLMVFLKWFAEHNWEVASIPLEEKLTKILDGMINALDERKGGKRGRFPRLNATILISDLESESSYEILAQDSSKTFSTELSIPQDHTVVGDVVRIGAERKNPSLLLYVPWTTFCHGVALQHSVEPGKDSPGKDSVVEMSVVDTTYKRIPQTGQEQLGCLLCIRIHLDQGLSINHRGHTISRPCAVLSLSSPRQDGLKIDAFDTARLISGLISRVMQQK